MQRAGADNFRKIMIGIVRLAGIGVVVVMAAALPAAEHAMGACTTPTWQIVVDPEHSRPFAPQLALRAQDLSVPAKARFDWGNGRFGIAVIDTPDGRGTIASLQPAYDKPGTYRLRFDIVDACGAAWHLPFEATVPLVLPPAARVVCPGELDSDAICIVSPLEHDFQIESAVAGDDAWQWTGGGPASASKPPHAAYRLTLATNDRTYVQAVRRTQSGWVVTPPLLVVARPAQHDSISDYVDPAPMTTGEEVTLGFTRPADAADAQATILVDGRQVAEAAHARVRLAAGDHEVAYELRYPDGQVVRRQIIVTARDAFIPPLGWIAPAMIVAVFLAVARLTQRRRGGPPGIASAVESGLLATGLGQTPIVPRELHGGPAKDSQDHARSLPPGLRRWVRGCICTALGSVYR
jgi:hypothetical protein